VCSCGSAASLANDGCTRGDSNIRHIRTAVLAAGQRVWLTTASARARGNLALALALTLASSSNGHSVRVGVERLVAPRRCGRTAVVAAATPSTSAVLHLPACCILLTPHVCRGALFVLVCLLAFAFDRRACV